MKLGLINQKGGVGKTTLTVNIAHELSQVFNTNEILVVDADPQQSALTWSETRQDEMPFSVIGYSKKTLHRDLPALANKYKHVVIDAPPRMTDITRSCMAACDLILVPCTPGPLDLWASAETLSLIEEAQTFNQNLKVLLVMNKAVKNTALSQAVYEALNNMDAKVLEVRVTSRVTFGEAASRGLTIFEYDEKSKACEEIKELVKEVLEFYEQKNIN